MLTAVYIVSPVLINLFTAKGLSADALKSLSITAHRGGAALGAENTLSCIEKGILAGADAIEIDIHLTKDGHLAVCHDFTVDRTTNGTGKISEMTLPELKQLKIIDNNGNPTDEQIPTLDEVLNLVNGRVELLIEVKRKQKLYQDIDQKLLRTIEAFEAYSWVVVQSFDDVVLENLHKLNPSLKLEKLLIYKFPGLPFIFDGTFTDFSFEKYHYVASFNMYYKTINRSFINKIHKKGKAVKIWTINDPEKAPNLPVDGVITDKPDVWRKVKDKVL